MMKHLVSLVVLCLASIGLATAAVNLNTATPEQLDAVKGIGASKAKAIVEYRNKNGNFKSVDDLKNVKGFGAKSVDKLRPELTVSGETTAPTAAPAKPAIPVGTKK